MQIKPKIEIKRTHYSEKDRSDETSERANYCTTYLPHTARIIPQKGDRGTITEKRNGVTNLLAKSDNLTVCV